MNTSRFPKAERLCSRRQTEQLFQEGGSVFLFPFKLRFLQAAEKTREEAFPQVLISVPKRRFRKAVDRNWLKRRIREAYRLSKAEHKEVLYKTNTLAIMYVGKEKLPFSYLRRRLSKVLDKLAEAYDHS